MLGTRTLRFREVNTIHFAKNLVSISPSDSGRFNPTFRHVFRFRQVSYLAKFTKGKACWRNVESWRDSEIGEMSIIGEIGSSRVSLLT